MKTSLILLSQMVLFFHAAIAQTTKTWLKWDPATETINYLNGQAWPKEVKNYYDRLPAAAENKVRKPVWDLSKNAAGLYFQFHTNAQEIIVKYLVKGEKQMPHMPATGVSGLDLYGKKQNGSWIWAAGKYQYGDTVTASFKLQPETKQDSSIEYRLYLPLYNTVTWLEINYPNTTFLKPQKTKEAKPIVVYGTSIAQGACASRPGLAWTNILGRKLADPIINLAFSGNGRLEKELLEMILTIDAKLYILDCLPNLISGYVSNEELAERVKQAIQMIQEKRPNLPVIFTEHDGYMDEGLNEIRRQETIRVNNTMNRVIDSMIHKGYHNIYRLKRDQISQDLESTVDGTHPNDIGMMHYADAYEKIIDAIFRKREKSRKRN